MSRMIEVARAIASLAGDLATEAFGPRLTAVYSIGSSARGEFRPLVSDIDVALVLGGSLLETDVSTVESIRGAIVTSGTHLAERISLFWGTPTSMNVGSGGRFPAVDRLDLIQNGRLIRGTEMRRLLVTPKLRHLIVESAAFALARLRTQEYMRCLLAPAQLMAAGPLLLTKLILFPVRLLYTLYTGAVGPSENAVAHYLESSRGSGSTLAAAGLAWRSAPPAPGDESALQLIREQLVPLYIHFITQYVHHAAIVEHTELVCELVAWRTELVLGSLECGAPRSSSSHRQLDDHFIDQEE